MKTTDTTERKTSTSEAGEIDEAHEVTGRLNILQQSAKRRKARVGDPAHIYSGRASSLSITSSPPVRSEPVGLERGGGEHMTTCRQCSEKPQNESGGGPNLVVRTAARIFAYVASRAIWDLLS